jgi:hypothetical protein
MGVALLTRSIPSGPRAGFASSTSTTVLDTCGVAMLVSPNVLQGGSQAFLGMYVASSSAASPLMVDPVEARAETMFTPGAVTPGASYR